MPQEELIDQYVDRSSFRSDTDFILSNLKEVQEAYKSLSGTKVNLSGAATTAGVAGDARKLNSELAQSVKLNEQLSRAELNAAKAAKEQALAEKAKAQALKANQAIEQAGQRTAKENLKLIDQATNDYLILNRAYRDAALRAKGYFVTLGEGHPVTQQSVKDANDMLVILNKAENAVGQYARQANNSRAKFDGLAQSFAQVSRELPSLTISTQQFALAISNNLPMVADELRRASMEIKALKAEGKDAPSLFGRIASSIFSWQIGLSVGIALFTAYSKEIGNFFVELFKGKEIIDQTAASQKVLTDIMSSGNGEYAEAVKNVTELQINIALAKKGFLDKNAVVKQYNETIGKTTGEVRNLDQAERELGKNADAYIKYTLLKAAAQLALQESAKKALEAEKTRVEAEAAIAKDIKDEGSGLRGFFNSDEALAAQREFLKTRREQQAKGTEQEGQTFVDIAKRFQQQAAELAKKYKFNFFGDPGRAKETNKKFFDEALRDQADAFKALSEDQDLLARDRVDARLRAANLERQILDGQYKADIESAKGNAQQIEEIEQQYRFRKEKLERQSALDILVIRADAAKRQKEQDAEINKLFEQDQKDKLANEIAGLKDRSEAFTAQQEIDHSREILALNDQYEKRIAATRGNAKKRKEVEEQYAADRAEIEFRYAKIILANEIQLAKDILAAKEAAGEDVAGERAKLAELEMKLSDLVTNHIIKNEEKQLSAAQKKAAEIEKGLLVLKDVYGKVSDFVTGIVGAITDRQKNAIQDQIDQLDAQKQKEIEVVNQTVTNEQDKAAKIATINARAQAKKEELERRQRQLDIQRARFEKAANIGRIVIETALAVVHQLASGDAVTAVGRAIAAGVIGAAQLAVAIAQPIPRFKHGRDGGPATLGMVNDGGKQEVITSPDLSKAYLPKGTNSITYLPEDWRVFPDVDSFLATANKMAMRQAVSTPVAVDHNGELIWMMRGQIARIERAILNRPEHHTYLDNGEVRKMVKNANNYNRYIQENL